MAHRDVQRARSLARSALSNVFSRAPSIKGIFMQRAKVIRSLGMHIACSSHGSPPPPLPLDAANRLERVLKGSARVIAPFRSCPPSLIIVVVSSSSLSRYANRYLRIRSIAALCNNRVEYFKNRFMPKFLAKCNSERFCRCIVATFCEIDVAPLIPISGYKRGNVYFVFVYCLPRRVLRL